MVLRPRVSPTGLTMLRRLLGTSLVVAFAGAAALGSACSSSSRGGGGSSGGSDSGSGSDGSDSGSSSGGSSGSSSGSSGGSDSGSDSGSSSGSSGACTPSADDGGSLCYSGSDQFCTNVSPGFSVCRSAAGIMVSSCPVLNLPGCNAVMGCCKGPNGQGSISSTGVTCYYEGFGGGGCCSVAESECTDAGGIWSTTP